MELNFENEKQLLEIENLQRVYQSSRLPVRLSGSEKHHSDLTLLQLHSGRHQGSLHEDHVVRHTGLQGSLLERRLGVGVILQDEIAGAVETQQTWNLKSSVSQCRTQQRVGNLSRLHKKPELRIWKNLSRQLWKYKAPIRCEKNNIEFASFCTSRYIYWYRK